MIVGSTKENTELEEKMVPEYKDRIKNLILDADQIQFGDALEEIPMIVEVPESENDSRKQGGIGLVENGETTSSAGCQECEA